MTNPSYTQVGFRGRLDDGSEFGASWIDVQNANWTQDTGANFRVRFRIDETVVKAWTNKVWNLYYSLNGGAYTAVSGSTPVQFALSSNFGDSADCTEQLTGGTGTFLTNNNGMKEATGGSVNTGVGGEIWDTEWCLSLDAAQLSQNDTIALRIYDGSSAIAVYSNTPSITVNISATHITIATQPGEATGEGASAAVSAEQNVTVVSQAGESIAEGANLGIIIHLASWHINIVRVGRRFIFLPELLRGEAEAITSISVSTQAAEAIAEGVDTTVITVRHVTIATQPAEGIGEGAETIIQAIQNVSLETQAAEALAEGADTTVSTAEIVDVTVTTQTAEMLAEGAIVTISGEAIVSTQGAEALAEGANTTVAVVANISVVTQSAEAIGEGAFTTVSTEEIISVTVTSQAAEMLAEGGWSTQSLGAGVLTQAAETIADGANLTVTTIRNVTILMQAAEALAEGANASAEQLIYSGLFMVRARKQMFEVNVDEGLTVEGRRQVFTVNASEQ